MNTTPRSPTPEYKPDTTGVIEKAQKILFKDKFTILTDSDATDFSLEVVEQCENFFFVIETESDCVIIYFGDLIRDNHTTTVGKSHIIYSQRLDKVWSLKDDVKVKISYIKRCDIMFALGNNDGYFVLSKPGLNNSRVSCLSRLYKGMSDNELFGVGEFPDTFTIKYFCVIQC
ncbi:hypothetical protein EIN_181960 [Entamoeba invadens IP1]|uniref:hypothetical protein n=1 Tax=Entamoeba invadens IP1 TaxID=370355 RepID=UPI0002C3E525|nr:hypothetical protein EIN_181960 [Entamoeba invadens IP1]ELP93999.1 hypothetical protein EIN_181960 [Entamoeba invadens IP1]|eukprot:XP_004260770.1 hypothetical protein EIN_181960 [Entamoeba invadens IP1]